VAHELGHALMHNQLFLHRDKALDGSSSKKFRDLKELQADKFAACFLMPKKQVKSLFKEFFLTEKFVINENTVFALNEKSVSAFRGKCRDTRGLAKILAKASFYKNKSFTSLADTFQVSIETMAIRLEELGLLEQF
jgi:Zn-dependent peptidase ImmA (M78 family)